MKTLRDFLLEEVERKPLLLEQSLEQAGYTKISNAGRLSNAAQDVIQFANVSKARDATKDKSKWKDIRKKLGHTGDVGLKGVDFLLKYFKKKTKLSDFIKTPTEKGSNMVELKLTGEWKLVGGSEKSSWKVLKFWVWSILTVYGCPDAQDAEFYKNSKGILLVAWPNKGK